MASRTFAARLAALEALEAARRPEVPPYVCMHASDAEALDDPATPAEVRAAIVEAYQIGGDVQKQYVGVCLCDPPESCRVCAGRPVVSERE